MKIKRIKSLVNLLCFSMASISPVAYAGYSEISAQYQPNPSTVYIDEDSQNLLAHITKYISLKNFQLAGKLAGLSLGGFIIYKGARKIDALYNKFLLKDKFVKVYDEISAQSEADDNINSKISDNGDLIEHNKEQIKKLGKKISKAQESIAQFNKELNPVLAACGIHVPEKISVDTLEAQLNGIIDLHKKTSNLLAHAEKKLKEQNENMALQFEPTKEQFKGLEQRAQKNKDELEKIYSRISAQTQNTKQALKQIEALINKINQTPEKLKELNQQFIKIGIQGTPENEQFVAEAAQEVVKILLENARAERALGDRYKEISNQPELLDID